MSDSRFINRELSWLEFNQRVLDEGRDESVPLLERLKFLAITASNLDEFFMVRVGGLQLLVEQGATKADPAGMTPADQLTAIDLRTRQMCADQYQCFSGELEPALAEAGLVRVEPAALTDRQSHDVRLKFENEIFNVFTPMAVASNQFPQLVNQSLSVCLQLAPGPGEEQPRFAVIPFGRSASRFVTLHSDRGYSYILLEDVVAMLAQRFFPGEDIVECVPFRIIRNADVAVSEDRAADLLAGMQEMLNARKRTDCVRLEIDANASDPVRTFLQTALRVDDENIFSAPGPLDLSAFMSLGDVRGFDELKYEAWPPQHSPDVDTTTSLFNVLAERDVVLYHPYDRFDPVVRLLDEAADDPDVMAIKQTLYRTSGKSPIIAALRRAAQNGKHVTALVELKARFDEARNIAWAKDLEQNEVQVIYGVKGLKTHSKVCIIVRREPRGIQRYVHFGTGNYNENTARLYSDVSFMTSNEDLGADAANFLNAISGYSQPQEFRKIEMAPIGLRESFLEMIEAETQRKKQGQKADIVAKVNSLVDSQIIEALYEASQAGVTVRLNVRGICCLRPGVPGLSENISVISIVDRFLEHARIFYFYHGGDERVFISSADWMPRNLDRRVELLVPVEDTACQRQLISILDVYFQDNVKAQELNPDGTYQRVARSGEKFRSQQVLYLETVEAVKQAEQSRRTVLEALRAADAS